MIAFLLAAFFAGVVIVYVVPFVNGWFAKVPGASVLVNNKFAQLIIIGAIVLLALHVFLYLAKEIE